MTAGPDASAAFCAVLVDEWVRAGLTDAVIAPGSRSTPIIIALAASPVRLHVVLDERSAGFCALGLGLASGRPAAVVTTSGTAAVELHPAVVEADQAGVPLLVVTADRPPELHHVGAPQTVEQDALFGTSTRWTVSPGVADDTTSSAWRSLASRTALVASGSAGHRPGPVHLNVAFRDPLLGDPGDPVPGRVGGRPWHRVTMPGDAPPVDRSAGALPASGAGPASAPSAPPATGARPPVVAQVIQLLVDHRWGRGVVLAGAGAGDPEVMATFARRMGWPLLADPRSGLRTPGPGTVAAADALLRVPEVARVVPDIVVRVGGPWASKVVNEWFDALPASVPRVIVDPSAIWADPGHQAEHVAAVAPASLAQAVLDQATSDRPDTDWDQTPWAAQWRAWETAAQAAIDTALNGGGDGRAMTEPDLTRRLVAGLHDGTILVTSSSMPVRDVEWWARPRSGIRVLANRGANGIDGVLSMAIGVALGSAQPTVALVGDLAYLYDVGALLWARDRPIDLTVVVVDNDGGGIFSFLPQATALEATVFERFWGTPHGTGVDLLAIAAAYGIEGRRAVCGDDVVAALGGGRGVRVVVVPTDRSGNVAVHQRLQAAVADAVRAAQDPGG